MSSVSARLFTALALLATSTTILAAPANSLPVNPTSFLPFSPFPTDAPKTDGVAAPVSKRAQFDWPSRYSDCLINHLGEGDDPFEHDGQNYGEDCLLALALSIKIEDREVCRSTEGRGYENDCLLSLVFEVDVEVKVEEEEKEHRGDRDMRRRHPERRSDCALEESDDDDVCPFWSEGPRGERFDDDCVFRLSLLVDIDGEQCMGPHGLDNDCVLRLIISVEVDIKIGDHIVLGEVVEAVEDLVDDVFHIIHKRGELEWPSHHSDCARPEFWGLGRIYEDHGEKYGYDCLLRFVVRLDIETKEVCKRGREFDEECLIKLVLSLDVSLEV